jgi:hypothetical protein
MPEGGEEGHEALIGCGMRGYGRLLNEGTGTDTNEDGRKEEKEGRESAGQLSETGEHLEEMRKGQVVHQWSVEAGEEGGEESTGAGDRAGGEEGEEGREERRLSALTLGCRCRSREWEEANEAHNDRLKDRRSLLRLRVNDIKGGGRMEQGMQQVEERGQQRKRRGWGEDGGCHTLREEMGEAG